MAAIVKTLPLLALFACSATSGTDASDRDGDGQSPSNGDCDDNDPSIYSGAPDITGDGVDSNCDRLDRQALSPADAVAVFNPARGAWFAGTSLGLVDLTGDGQLDIAMGAPGGVDYTNRIFVGVGTNQLANRFDETLNLGEVNPFLHLGGRIEGGFDADGDGIGDALLSSLGEGASYLVTEPVFDGWTADDANATAGADPNVLWSATFWPDTNGDGMAEILTSTATDPGGGGGELLSLNLSPFANGVDSLTGVILGEDPLTNIVPTQLTRVPDMTGDGLPELTYQSGARPEQIPGFQGITLLNLATSPPTRYYFAVQSAPHSPWGGGDLTGEGESDFIIGVPDFQDPDSGANTGALFIVTQLPEPDQISDLSDAIRITGVGNDDYFGGYAVVHDVNGDGQDDLIVSASLRRGTANGRVHVFFGPITEDTTAEDADVIISSNENPLQFGASLAVGDLNNDDVPDLVVGAPLANEDVSGRVYLFDGRGLWAP